MWVDYYTQLRSKIEEHKTKEILSSLKNNRILDNTS